MGLLREEDMGDVSALKIAARSDERSPNRAHYQPACFSLIGLVPWILFAMATSVGAAVGEDESSNLMDEIIENLRSSEKLYQNLEVRYRKSYSADAKSGSLSKFAILWSRLQARQVFQDGLIFFKQDGEQEQLDGRKFNTDTLQGFDGETTRVVEQNGFANIHHGRFVDGRTLEPHRILDHGWHIARPLSAMLSTTELDGATITWRFEGEEMVDDLQCYKIRGEARQEGKDGWVSYFWIAPERNYLLIKCVGYRGGIEQPVEIGVVEDLEEIAPGIWFPMKSTSLVYDQKTVRAGNPVVIGRHETQVDSVKLDPQYDICLFSDIEIPKGILVYVVRDGKIVGSYYEGGLPGVGGVR